MSDDAQQALIRLALRALQGTDFVLAGAGAIREHGLTSRPTQDVDLFTASLDAAAFDGALARLLDALAAQGWRTEVVRRGATFARLQITDPDGEEVEADLAADWRGADPVLLGVGPVLALSDAVASKLGALYSRAEVRDFLDVDAIRTSTRFSDAELLALVAARDPGFDAGMFATQVALVSKLRLSEVVGYGVDAQQLKAVRRRLLDWAEELAR